jgi:hypothetical protein
MQQTNSRPHPIFGRIPQLDGGTEKETLQCPTCQKTFEDDDDIRWHYETVIGREDYSILRSMLGWHPD